MSEFDNKNLLKYMSWIQDGCNILPDSMSDISINLAEHGI